MFKKLTLMALAVSCSYGMEPIKDIENKEVNSITQQMNNITLNNVQNNTNDISNPQTSVAQPHLFDIKKLVTTKHFIKMNEDEKDWARLNAYDRLSKVSQKFWQTVIAEKKITDITKAKLYCSQSFRLCVLMGVDPFNVIFDELKYNIDKTCLADSKLYLSDDQLSALKAQVIQCISITRRHILCIRAIQEHLNMNNSNLAECIYWKLYRKKNVNLDVFLKNLDAFLKNLQKKNP